MFALLLACADPQLIDAPAGVAVSAPTFAALAAEHVDDLAERTHVERTGALRFADAGPVAGGGDGDDRWDILPVVEADSGVRVAVEADGVRLLPWLDREDLRIALAETTWIGADGHRVAPGEPGVQLRGGVLPDLSGDEPRVHASDHSVGFSLPVNDGLLDEVYVETALDRLPAPETFVLGETTVTDAAGVEIARSTPGALPWAVHEVRRSGDRVLVEGGAGRTWGEGTTGLVRGWVLAASLGEPDTLYGFGGCCCCGGFGRHGWGTSGPNVTLAPDQLLYDAPDGDVVGVVTRPTTRGIDREAGDLPGWTPLSTWTNWGSLTVWVADAGPTLPEVVAPDDATPASHAVFAAAEAERRAKEEALELALDRATAQDDREGMLREYLELLGEE